MLREQRICIAATTLWGILTSLQAQEKFLIAKARDVKPSGAY